MPTTGDNLGLTISDTQGAANWNSWLDVNLGLLDAVLFLDVINRVTTAPPGSPAAGDRYLVAAGATGAWSGHDGEIAVYRAAAWVFYTPAEGWLMTSQADAGKIYKHQGGSFAEISGGGGASALNDLSDVAVATPASEQILEYNGSVFANRAPRLDIATWIDGIPAASQVCLRFIAVRAFSLPASLTGSQSKAGSAATGSTTIDIKKNGSNVGSINYAAAASTGTFTMASQTDFAAGDVLTIVAPGTPDASLADVAITLRSL